MAGNLAVAIRASVLLVFVACGQATFAADRSDAGTAKAAPAPSASATPGVRNSAAPSFTPCQIENLTGIVVYNAECADIEFPENWKDPGGRRIKLRVARVPAINRRKSPDPLFLLAGGPGMGAIDLYGNVASSFARIRRNRDIVLVDQRGTGNSNPLHCHVDDLTMLSGDTADLVRETNKCLEQLKQRADLAYYSTSVAVKDLDLVRGVMGYEQINLYGGSYGTRVAQHYLRRYPEHTRTVILDGVIAPEQVVGPDIALDAESALKNVFARCTADAGCKKAFGDPAETYRALRTALEAKPVSVSYMDPTTGSPSKMELGALHLALVLRLSIYTSEQAALLPLTLHLAHHAGNFAPLTGQFLMTMRTYSDILAYGMHNSVVCTEDVPFYRDEDIDRAKLNATFMGAAAVDGLRNVCESWPRGPMDADLHAPLKSSVPVLLLSGGNDPVTPAANGDLAKKGLSNSLHLVLPDLGHGQIGAPCMDRVMADFVVGGTVSGLDVSCTTRAKPMPFFTTLAGPEP